jgi:hypothetical protein
MKLVFFASIYDYERVAYYGVFDDDFNYMELYDYHSNIIHKLNQKKNIYNYVASFLPHCIEFNLNEDFVFWNKYYKIKTCFSNKFNRKYRIHHKINNSTYSKIVCKNRFHSSDLKFPFMISSV